MGFRHASTILMHVYVDCSFAILRKMFAIFPEKMHDNLCNSMVFIKFLIQICSNSLMCRDGADKSMHFSHSMNVIWEAYLPVATSPVSSDWYFPLFGCRPTSFPVDFISL